MINKVDKPVEKRKVGYESSLDLVKYNVSTVMLNIHTRKGYVTHKMSEVCFNMIIFSIIHLVTFK